MLQLTNIVDTFRSVVLLAHRKYIAPTMLRRAADYVISKID